MSPALRTVLGVVLLVGPVLFVLPKLRGADIAASFQRTGPSVLAVAFVFSVLSPALGALRWRQLIAAYGATRVPTRFEALRHFMVSQYANMLPGGVAGDVLRAVRVQDCFVAPAQSYLVAATDRMLGLVGLMALAGCTLMVGPSLGHAAAGATIGGILALVASAGAMLAPTILTSWPGLRRLVAKVPVLGSHLLAIEPPRRVADLVLPTLVSVAAQGAYLVALLVVLRAVEPGADLLRVMQMAPLVVLLTYLPLTPGGVGQREVIYIELFGLVGVSASAALAASVIVFVLSVAMSAIGALCLMLEPSAARASERSAS
jgi:uncharacterized membrane protein YbhN (UPF0104 family)